MAHRQTGRLLMRVTIFTACPQFVVLGICRLSLRMTDKLFEIDDIVLLKKHKPLLTNC